MTQAATSGRDRYEVERTLGHGGMATVYLARDTVLGRRVALKVLAEHLTGDESFRARFLREARLAARVVHPNVVQVYDAGGDDAGLFIAMEYVDGESLAEELARRGRLSAGEVVDVGCQLAAALAAAHAAGLVHRDVKPPNILRARDGTVKLGDFGIAHSHDSTALTAHGSVLGTAAYLAPEQARAEPVTGASDLYALGVVLYEALTGRRPHEGSSLAELVLRREQEPVTPPSAVVADVPPTLDEAILRCLALRPEQRPPSAAAVGAELAAALPESATHPLPAPTDTRATQVLPAATRVVPVPNRRRWLVGALIVLGALAAGIVLGVIAFGGSGERERRATPATVRAKPPPATAAAPVTTVPTTTAARTPVATPPPPPPPLPPVQPSAAGLAICAGVEQRRQQLEDMKLALEEQKHATKDKLRHRILDAHKHALDDQKHQLDAQRKACR